MFNLKNKLSPNLKYALDNYLYEKYRVIIKCSTLLERIEKKISNSKCEIIRTIPSLNCTCALINRRLIERLIEYPQVSYIDFDTFAFSIPCDVTEINLEKENLYLSKVIDTNNNFELNGKNVTVGLISTGLYPNKDLIKPENRIIKCIDLINGFSHAYDDNGMGTFVGGIIGGNGFCSEGNIKGVAPRCHFYSIKAFNKNGKGYISDILYSLYLLEKDLINFNIKIIYLPFELFQNDKFILDLFQESFNVLANKGVTLIVPSGSNEGSKNTIKGISTLNNIICVGGLSSIKPSEMFKFSSCGPCYRKRKPDFLAPCCNIYTLFMNINYIPEKDNIKLYAPHLSTNYVKINCSACAGAYYAGICALLYEHRNDLTIKDIYSLLKLSSTELDMPKELQNHGMVYVKDLTLPKANKKKV